MTTLRDRVLAMVPVATGLSYWFFIHGMERSNDPKMLSGQHVTAATAHGVLLLRGPLIRVDNRLGEVDMLDVLPTVLELLGVAPPDTLPGKVVTAALVRDHALLPRHPGPYPEYRPDRQ